MQLHSQGTITPAARAPRPIDPGTRIGHVHLRTADIDRIRDFYVGILGFDLVFEARGVPGWGTTGDILFVSAGGYHHHLGFNTWKSAGGSPQPDGVTGLHHGAINYPNKAAPGGAAPPRAPTAPPAPTTSRSTPRPRPPWPTRSCACRRPTARCARRPITGR